MRKFGFSLIIIFYSIRIWYKHSQSYLHNKDLLESSWLVLGYFLKFWLNHQHTLAQHVMIAMAQESVLRHENLNK